MARLKLPSARPFMLQEIARRSRSAKLDQQDFHSEYDNEDPTKALAILSKAPFKIYLGGSRRMAEITMETCMVIDGVPADEFAVIVTDATDYDFYATYSDELASFLTNHGFHVTDFISKLGSDIGYEIDDEAVTILQRSSVQIVLRKDAEFYRKVFEAIPVEFYYNHLWKSSPAKPNRSQIQPIFNALFAIGHATETKNAK